jgi:hypothetical protein
MATDAAVTIAARLDRLPPSRHTRRLVTLLSLGGWFEFYDLFFTAYIAIGLFKAGIFTPTARLVRSEGLCQFRRRSVPRPVHRHARLQPAVRPIRPALDLHLRAALVFDRRLRHLPASGSASSW